MSGDESKREHTGGVLGIFLGLLLVLTPLFGFLAIRGGPIDGEERLAQLFGTGEPPFGLELAEAHQLPTGEVVLRLQREIAGEDEENMAEPEEVVLVEFSGPAPAAALFARGGMASFGRGDDDDDGGGASEEASRQLMAWEKDPSFAWHTTIERDEISWSKWRAPFLIERAFREGGGWRDSARVNLIQKGRNLVLFAQWPEETAVSRENLGRILRSIEMLEIEES